MPKSPVGLFRVLFATLVLLVAIPPAAAPEPAAASRFNFSGDLEGRPKLRIQGNNATSCKIRPRRGDSNYMCGQAPYYNCLGQYRRSDDCCYGGWVCSTVSDGMGYDEGPPPFGQGRAACAPEAYRGCAMMCVDNKGGFSTAEGTRCMKTCEIACNACGGGQRKDRCMALE